MAYEEREGITTTFEQLLERIMRLLPGSGLFRNSEYEHWRDVGTMALHRLPGSLHNQFIDWLANEPSRLRLYERDLQAALNQFVESTIGYLKRQNTNLRERNNNQAQTIADYQSRADSGYLSRERERIIVELQNRNDNQARAITELSERSARESHIVQAALKLKEAIRLYNTAVESLTL